MQPAWTKSAFFRVVLAMLFGFMTLGHEPIMAMAKAGTAPHHQHSAPSVPAHHQSHSSTAPASSTIPANPAIICTGSGCFLVVAPALIAAPAADFFVLGLLSPGSPRTLLAAPPEPADPPPRLQG